MAVYVFDDRRNPRRLRYGVRVREPFGEEYDIRGFEGNTSREFAGYLARLVRRLRDFRHMSRSPDAETWRMVTALPPAIRDKLRERGLIDLSLAQDGKPLAELAEDWLRSLMAAGLNQRYVNDSRTRVLGLLKALGWKTVRDASKPGLEEWLVSSLERNASRCGIHIRAKRLLAFFRHLRQTKVIAENPLELVKLPEGKAYATNRRELSPEEQSRLLATAEGDSAVKSGLGGRDWAMRILFSLWTAIRWNELRQLKRRNILLEGDRLGVVIPDAISKNRHGGFVPLRPEAAARLRDYFREFPIPPEAPAFRMPAERSGARYLDYYLDKAGIAKVDGDGQILVWHSLRHTAVSNWVRAGLHPKVISEWARHDIKTSMKRYAHLEHADHEAAAAQTPLICLYSGEPATPDKQRGLPTFPPTSGKDVERNTRTYADVTKIAAAPPASTAPLLHPMFSNGVAPRFTPLAMSGNSRFSAALGETPDPRPANPDGS